MSKRLLILGGGESGVGCAKLAKKNGYEVFLSDKGKIKDSYKSVLSNYNIDFEENQHSEKAYKKADIVMKSPGIPSSVDIVKHQIELGAKLVSEIEFAYGFTKAKIIGITGTNGKTTTTLLTYHLLKKADLDVGLCGNVGISMAGLLAERDYDYLVIEISSFQLDDIHDFKADVAMILNITPDHLERYESLEQYVSAKFRITENLTEKDHFIYQFEDEIIQKKLESSKIKAKHYPVSLYTPQNQGAHLDNNDKQLVITVTQNPIKMSIHDLALQGKHNIYNSMAASVAGRVLELRKDIIRESLTDFQNVEHRLESVSSVCGVTYVNDSKATNVNSAWYALESSDSPVLWIAGGVDKGNDYTALLPLVKEKVKAIICLGKDNKKLKEFFGDSIEFMFETESMQDAVNIAYRLSTKEDTVLLSPACASFDLFENYEDRGRQFKDAVRSL